jgi:hypothetical protein
MTILNNRWNLPEKRKGKRNTKEIYRKCALLLVFSGIILQPFDDLARQKNNKDKQQNPACGLYFPSHCFHLFLLAYPQEPGLRFVKHQLHAP